MKYFIGQNTHGIWIHREDDELLYFQKNGRWYPSPFFFNSKRWAKSVFKKLYPNDRLIEYDNLYNENHRIRYY